MWLQRAISLGNEATYFRLPGSLIFCLRQGKQRCVYLISTLQTDRRQKTLCPHGRIQQYGRQNVSIVQFARTICVSRTVSVLGIPLRHHQILESALNKQRSPPCTEFLPICSPFFLVGTDECNVIRPRCLHPCARKQLYHNTREGCLQR